MARDLVPRIGALGELLQGARARLELQGVAGDEQVGAEDAAADFVTVVAVAKALVNTAVSVSLTGNDETLCIAFNCGSPEKEMVVLPQTVTNMADFIDVSFLLLDIGKGREGDLRQRPAILSLSLVDAIVTIRYVVGYMLLVTPYV